MSLGKSFRFAKNSYILGCKREVHIKSDAKKMLLSPIFTTSKFLSHLPPQTGTLARGLDEQQEKKTNVWLKVTCIYT
jgi:hypothetical protein